MSELFKYIDDNNVEHILVSKDYVDMRIKNLKEAIRLVADNTHIDDNTFKLLDSSEEVLINNNSNTGISAKLIKQDSKHKMLTDNDISIFKSKPSTHEVNNLIRRASNSIKDEITSLFNDLFNTSDTSLQRLKRLTELVKNEEVLNSLFKILDDSITLDEFNEHISNSIHLNNNDRNALNILLGMINNGTFDKLNKYINDIDSLLNDIKQYVNDNITADRYADDIILGLDNTCTHKLSLDDPDNNSYIINKLSKGNIAIKSGFFECNVLELNWTDNKYRIIHGNGSIDTTIHANMCTTRWVNIRDLRFLGTIDENRRMPLFCDDTKFDNITFESCNIFIGSEVRLSGCKFINCNINFDTNSMNNMIFNCAFINTEIPKVIRPNTIIENNY